LPGSRQSNHCDVQPHSFAHQEQIVSVATKHSLDTAQVFNVPNQLTGLRLLLSVVLFVLIGLEAYLASTVVFVIAASTDWIDGYWARKYGQVTTLGRILDPFVDKIIICGTFIFLVAIPSSRVPAWMAVVVVGRELLVTALRSFLEGEGADFSAKMSGKLKMVFQCAAATLALACLSLASREAWLDWLLVATVWLAVLMTVYSGLQYVWKAWRLLRG
jgi:CDP-diacylglycerol---glycerol-3-phosphate 3-phosphatidyltransferase